MGTLPALARFAAMTLSTLDDLFARGLRHLHAAHHQGAKQTAINHELAHAPKLRSALRTGLTQNSKQIERLEKAFASVGLPVIGDPDRAMAGIADDNNVVIARMSRSPELDQELIRTGQVAAHFYLANYGTMRAYARSLGHRRAAKLLEKTIDEQSTVDEAFTKLAETLRRSTTSKVARGLGVATALGLAAAGAVAAAQAATASDRATSKPRLPRKLQPPVTIEITD